MEALCYIFLSDLSSIISYHLYIYKTEAFGGTTIFHVNTTQYLKNKIKNTIFLSKTQYLSSFFG